MDPIHSVLIIDDEVDFCMVMTQYLKKRHIDVACAYSLKEASSLLSSLHPTLIFLDNNLPDGLGINLIPEIKKTENPAIVVVVTGYDAEQIGPHALQLGADMFMAKPLNVRNINEVLRTFLPQ